MEHTNYNHFWKKMIVKWNLGAILTQKKQRRLNKMAMRQQRQPECGTQGKVHGSFSLWKCSCPSLTDAFRTH